MFACIIHDTLKRKWITRTPKDEEKQPKPGREGRRIYETCPKTDGAASITRTRQVVKSDRRPKLSQYSLSHYFIFLLFSPSLLSLPWWCYDDGKCWRMKMLTENNSPKPPWFSYPWRLKVWIYNPEWRYFQILVRFRLSLLIIWTWSVREIQSQDEHVQALFHYWIPHCSLEGVLLLLL